MLLTRTIRMMCANVKAAQYLKKHAELTASLAQKKKQIDNLHQKLKKDQENNKKRNQHIHELRIKLTKDVQKADELRADAKKKINAIKAQTTQQFAKKLTDLAKYFKEVQQAQTQEHPLQLRQGVSLTARLYFNTLTKFNITEYQVKQDEKFNGKTMQKVGEQKTEQQKKKQNIAKVIENGWTAEGKVISPAKVIVYI